MRGATHHHSRPQNEGGRSTNTAHFTMSGGTAHNEMGHAPAEHAQQSEGPHTNAPRPTMRGATQQHSTPHHEGAHTPTQHYPSGGGPCNSTARRSPNGWRTTRDWEAGLSVLALRDSTTATDPQRPPQHNTLDSRTHRPLGCKDDARPTKPAVHCAGDTASHQNGLRTRGPLYQEPNSEHVVYPTAHDAPKLAAAQKTQQRTSRP